MSELEEIARDLYDGYVKEMLKLNSYIDPRIFVQSATGAHESLPVIDAIAEELENLFLNETDEDMKPKQPEQWGEW